jgi:hypothetical protein
LNLLKRDPQSITKHLLAHADLKASRADALTNAEINGTGRSPVFLFAHRF